MNQDRLKPPTAFADAAFPEVLSQVAWRTAQTTITIWGYGVGGALTGLLRAGQRLNDPGLVDAVAERVRPSLTAPDSPTDHLISVEALLTLHRLRPDLSVSDALDRFLAAVARAERPVPDQPPVHRPDLDRWGSTIWVDCLHTDGPGLALLGEIDTAVKLTQENVAALQRADGLFHHGYDITTSRGNDVAWGRGQGWALLGLVDTLTHTHDPELSERLHRLLVALAATEHDGRWHTVVDDPKTPPENSVAAYIAVGVRRARAAGLVGDEFDAMAQRSANRTLEAVCDGALLVSEASPVGTVADYAGRASGVYPWGQAPVLELLTGQWDRM